MLHLLKQERPCPYLLASVLAAQRQQLLYHPHSEHQKHQAKMYQKGRQFPLGSLREQTFWAYVLQEEQSG